MSAGLARNRTMTDEEIDALFEEFLASPELASWTSDLSAREHDISKWLFRIAVRKALESKPVALQIRDTPIDLAFVEYLGQEIAKAAQEVIEDAKVYWSFVEEDNPTEALMQGKELHFRITIKDKDQK